MLSRIYCTTRRCIGYILLDAVVLFLSFYLCRFLLLGGKVQGSYVEALSCLVAIPIYCSVNYLFALYHRIWRYASAQEVVVIFEAVVFSTLVLALTNVLLSTHSLSLQVLFLRGFFTFAGFTAARYRWRLVKGFPLRWRALWGHWPVPPAKVLIVGAGEAGQLLAWQLRNQDDKEVYNVIGFIDDDPHKQGMWLHGVKILGNRQQISDIVIKKDVDLIVLAAPNMPDSDRQEMVSICLETSARIKLLPDTFDVIDSKKDALPIKDITIQDLVDREPVSIDFGKCRQIMTGKIIMVTGAAGSIGSELCRQLLNFEPRRLLALDNNETGLYKLNLELNQDGNSPLRLVLADITNAWRMEKAFQEQRPDIVFHAAAYKHVPSLERQPDEAVRVNVMGTVILSQLADKYEVGRFVYISTDKAVNPTSVMGASKRIGEMWITALQQDSRILYTTVRFGNVIGSRGSVVPTFQRQIERGGPVTVTHPDMTRFFLGIPEAARLTIHAASFAEGEKIYMLDMGKEVRILDLAYRMIRLKGLRIGKDIQIKFTGIRPGEKLHEELFYTEEIPGSTPNPRIFSLQAFSNNDFDREILLGQIMILAECAQKGWAQDHLRQALLLAATGDLDSFLNVLAGVDLLRPFRQPSLPALVQDQQLERGRLRTASDPLWAAGVSEFRKK